MRILVTGAAGFIGSGLMRELARRGESVVGLDNINDYYDVRLKYGRLALCGFGHEEESEMPWGEMQTSSLMRASLYMIFAVSRVGLTTDVTSTRGPPAAALARLTRSTA